MERVFVLKDFRPFYSLQDKIPEPKKNMIDTFMQLSANFNLIRDSLSGIHSIERNLLKEALSNIMSQLFQVIKSSFFHMFFFCQKIYGW